MRADFSLEACKRSVAFSVERLGENPTEMLKEFKQRAEEDVFFNRKMITAVESYIADHK